MSNKEYRMSKDKCRMMKGDSIRNWKAKSKERVKELGKGFGKKKASRRLKEGKSQLITPFEL